MAKSIGGSRINLWSTRQVAGRNFFQSVDTFRFGISHYIYGGESKAQVPARSWEAEIGLDFQASFGLDYGGEREACLFQECTQLVERTAVNSKLSRCTIFGVWLLLAGTQSQAALLGLSPAANAPDFEASFINVTYVASNDIFQAGGFITDYANGTVPLIGIGSYTLTATITDAGLLTGGTLTVNGDVGFGPQTLLTGTLDAIGYMDPPGGSLFEYLFTVSGGNATIVQDFGGMGATNCGVILDAWFVNGGIPFNGSWTNDFNNDSFSGLSDNFAAVPEPSSILLVLLGGIGGALLFQRRR